MMEETERLIELMLTSTDRLAVNVLDAVTQIIHEKKLVRKHYAEKRNSMDMELNRVCGIVCFFVNCSFLYIVLDDCIMIIVHIDMYDYTFGQKNNFY